VPEVRGDLIEPDGHEFADAFPECFRIVKTIEIPVDYRQLDPEVIGSDIWRIEISGDLIVGKPVLSELLHIEEKGKRRNDIS
jgi:hypothetical protein